MTITERAIDQAFSELKPLHGGLRNDYLGLLYLERAFALDRDRAISQVAFGGNDYGVDGFHFDGDKRNLYLFQFKCSGSLAQFKGSFDRLIDPGMEHLFGAQNQDQHQNELLLQLKSCLTENEAVIDRVCVHFVTTGDPAEAERSQVLDRLREDLENKKYLIDQRFGRAVPMVVEFRSANTGKVGSMRHVRTTHTYSVRVDDTVVMTGPNGETMTIGSIRLTELHDMYRDMGERFFERNIRGALPENGSVNRSIQQALKRMVLDGSEDPKMFAFNHNGVTLSAEAIKAEDNVLRITEPRLLNGAQTVTTLSRFLKANAGNNRVTERQGVLADVRVLCRIITEVTQEFVTTVTTNNNRQNPIKPWNLHANDMIQLELQDKFREDLGKYYERQERAFQNLSDVDLEEQGFDEHRAIELTKLARTFLVSDGEIDKMTRFREVFEDDRLYNRVFERARLKADSRKIVLCYKVQFRLGRLATDIAGRGANKYAYVLRTRDLLWALLCQAMLNDPNIEERADNFGHRLSLEPQYTEWLSTLATTKCRHILSDLTEEKCYVFKAHEGNFTFMKTNAAYQRSMEIAHKRWKWVAKRLR